jgi:hypothetical protein
MGEQIGGFYVALLFLALIGVLIFVNALLGMGLRWLGRRVASVWRHESVTSGESGSTVEHRHSVTFR